MCFALATSGWPYFCCRLMRHYMEFNEDQKALAECPEKSFLPNTRESKFHCYSI